MPKAKAVPKPKGRQIAPSRFTPKKQAEFLMLIAVGWAVLHAATKIGITKMTAYALRERDPDFAAAWEAAKEDGQHRLEEEANRRAMGWVELRTDKDGESYESYKCSDTLMIFLLKSMDPRRYRDSMDININERRHIVLDLLPIVKDEATGKLMVAEDADVPLLAAGEVNDG